MLAAADDPAVRSWLADLGLRVQSGRRLVGGLTTLTEAVVVSDQDAHRTEVVLRRWGPLRHAADHDPVVEATSEIDVLELRRDDPLTPDVIAADLDGRRCRVPAVLLERLPGAPVVAPVDVDSWLHGLVSAIVAVRAHPMSTVGLRPFTPWFTADGTVPEWSSNPGAWNSARSRVLGRALTGGPSGPVHRDLHPGNVLFDRDPDGRHRLTGIVDWGNATDGPIEIDVSRCRVEVAMVAGIDTAENLLDGCIDAGVQPPGYDRGWDALVALEVAGALDRIAPTFRQLGSTVTVGEMEATLDRLVTDAAS